MTPDERLRRYADQHLRRAAIELGPAEMLGKTPAFMLEWIRSWREERSALIQLTGDAEVDVDGLDGDGRATPIMRDDVWVLS